jgi:DNA-binding NtrC family response regulator
MSAARELLYLQPANKTGPLLPRLRSAGWNVSVAHSAVEACEAIERRNIHVGLAHIDDNGATLNEIADVWPHADKVEWVAMLDSMSLRSPGLSRLISDHFYDYHTLPADVDRLLFSLGHAYGMATVSPRAAKGHHDTGAATGMPAIGHYDALAQQPQQRPTLSVARAQAERTAIVASLVRTGHNVSRAARELEVSRVTLYRLMKKYRIGG